MSGFRRGLIAAESVDPSKKVPLTLTAVQAGSTVALNATGSPTVSGLQYRYGTSGAWSAYTCGTALTLASVGDAVQFQNTEKALSTGSNDYVSFAFSGKIAASGNAMSMLNWRKVCSNYCYRRMFYNCNGLTQAPELPATYLANQCYAYMFYGCTGLTQAPTLPATTLATHCYYGMFRNCTGLTQAPELPVTNLANQCYYEMFKGCTGLTQAPELPATYLTAYCYASMFEGCTGLTQAPELPATDLANNCYFYMFSNCIKLTQAPALPARILASACYSRMFEYTGLTQAPELPATYLANQCYAYMFSNCIKLTSVRVSFKAWDSANTKNWLYGVASGGAFHKPSALPNTRGVSNIPEGWTVVNID